jgi:hypothetical protein
MKKIIVLLSVLCVCIFACNTKKNDSEDSKFELKKDEKIAELIFERVDAEMFENFIFKSIDNQEKSFFVDYNDNESWNQISEKLITGEKYTVIYKYVSYEKEFQELKQNNIGTDDVPPSGNYIFYIEDLKGNVVFKNDVFEINIKNENTNINSKIDNKYIEYLKGYYPNGLGNYGENVEIKRVNEKTFWVTYAFGSGTKQEIYWMLNGNSLIPMFEFEYGGMNWESGLSYTFININNKETINGEVFGEDSESQIEKLKQKFIFR